MKSPSLKPPAPRSATLISSGFGFLSRGFVAPNAEEAAPSANPAAAEACPLSEPELSALQPRCCVYDIIYTPRPTQLLQRAAARGCHSLDGLEMLVEQGAAALRLWSNRNDVPVAVMRRMSAVSSLTVGRSNAAR